MTTTTTTPRIYVASLSDYNAGILHGEWIDCEDVADMWADVQAMLEASPTAKAEGSVAEEWAIHDYEGFAGVDLGESEQFRYVADLAHAIEEHGETFAAWYVSLGTDDLDSDVVEQFLEAFQGIHDSEANFACYWAEEVCCIKLGDEWPHDCIDWDQAWRNLDGFWSARVTDGLAIFSQ